jgi:sigma-B regulation protein RsbU (phosphoserine phosphatase)
MAILVIVRGPQMGRQFPLRKGDNILGRQSDSSICLEAREVSRHHARIICHNDAFFIEDLGSINKTYLNGRPVSSREPLNERDVLQIGPYALALRPEPDEIEARTLEGDPELVIRGQLSVSSTNISIYDQGPAQKLQVVLEIAQHLGRTLDVNDLVAKLLDQLMRLFPQADRGLVVLGDPNRPTLQEVRERRANESGNFRYSRTLIQEALDKGVAIFSEDMGTSPPVDVSESIRSLNLRSVLCVPLICQDGRRLGIIQLDRSRPDNGFRLEDLHLLTTVGLQVAVVLENAALHAELLREERLRQELVVAREIQQGFLPTEFPAPPEWPVELFATVFPARQVSGDFYDFFWLPDGRLVFSVGDVSGKGMPAALFMVMVRTLLRHLAATPASPAETLRKLNAALAADNPSCMFVTLAHGLYEPTRGEIILATGAHPFPLLRRADGRTEQILLQPGLILGCDLKDLSLSDIRVTLQPGETLIFYTDGFTEARAPGGKTMFGLERLQQILSGPRAALPLSDCVTEVRAAVEKFTQTADLQDDLTLLLLRRV